MKVVFLASTQVPESELVTAHYGQCSLKAVIKAGAHFKAHRDPYQQTLMSGQTAAQTRRYVSYRFPDTLHYYLPVSRIDSRFYGYWDTRKAGIIKSITDWQR